MAASVRSAWALEDNQDTQRPDVRWNIPVAGSGAEVGDMALALVQNNSAINAFVAPAGWSQIGTTQTTGSNLTTQLFGKILTAGDLGATASFDAGSGVRCTGTGVIIQGHSGALPTNFNVLTDNSDGPSVVGTGLTTTGDNRLLITFAALRAAVANGSSASPDAAWTELAEANTVYAASPNFVSTVNSRQAPTAGPYPAITVSSPDQVRGHIWTVSIAPSTATPPNSAFTRTPASGAAPLEVAFTDTSTGAPTAWAWDFGDGGTSAVQNPTHQYNSPGTYTVTLTVSNAGGADPTPATATVTVTAVPPDSSFTRTPASGAAPLAVAFTDTSTGSPNGWAWDFGDGGTSSVQNPSHTYNGPGTYTVTLTASNAGGADPTPATATVTVTGDDPGFVLYKNRGGVYVPGKILRNINGAYV